MIEAGEILLKLKLDSTSNSMAEDLTKYLKPCPGKSRRTMRREASPPPGFSSSDHRKRSPKFVSSDQASAHLGRSRSEEELWPSDESGKLKRKLEETDVEGSGADSEIESGADNIDGESDIKISSSDDEISLSMKSSSGEAEDQVISIVHPKIYACCFCDKSFSSHLALGGHKSSHSKFRMIIYNAVDHRQRKGQAIITYKSDQQTREDHNSAIPVSIGDDRTHTCKICFKKFSSGQALGGHQRHHWTGNMTDQKKTLPVPKILDFDLNELPEEQDADPSSKC
ncbi:hypothetical protein F511_19331 [Dorcoceras hygrometricum]|uniref:C2H2-type domain-containing protein n=1 Tax=Dorcoceras hygrometricum TaxID=472368 RepID=A0A2Z7CBL7_9LAMI|nr:hypothetical protein F511_19331 [Dorcoceras hygrometricum]